MNNSVTWKNACGNDLSNYNNVAGDRCSCNNVAGTNEGVQKMYRVIVSSVFVDIPEDAE